jgi:gamma-glutamyltranspeptidase/glutathione hydrolase
VSVAALFFLAGCSSNLLDTLNPLKSTDDETKRGTIGFVEGFLGGVVADEPRAALIGRDILSSGGTAADAAVAVAFTLSVTLPSSASLGGGGLCVVHGAKNKTTETLDFLPAIPSKIGMSPAPPVAVPGFVRGLATLHAKYGKLQWSELVAPAEKLSRFGERVSRALARDLKQAETVLTGDPQLRKIFATGKDGAIVREGELLRQSDLSAILGRLRVRGGGDFYSGLIARQLVAALGGSLSSEDLRTYTPRWRPTVKVPYAKEANFHFAMPPGPSGVLAAQMIGVVMKEGGWENGSAALRAHLLAEATGRPFADRGRWLQGDGAPGVPLEKLISKENIAHLTTGYRADRHTTWVGAGAMPAEDPGNRSGVGFVVADREGSAVACGLTLNNLFGVGRVASGTGILLAALPGLNGRGTDDLAPMLLISNLFNIFYYAAVATGGAAAPSALINVTARTLLGKEHETIQSALSAKRIHNSGIPDMTFYEQGTPDDVVKALAAMGHQVREAPTIGQVNMIYCPEGVPKKEGTSCANLTDPRGFGLGAGNE